MQIDRKSPSEHKDKDLALRDRFVDGIFNASTKMELKREFRRCPSLTFDKVLSEAVAFERDFKREAFINVTAAPQRYMPVASVSQQCENQMSNAALFETVLRDYLRKLKP